MGIVTSIRRHRAIKAYIEKLPALLAKDYGKSKTYTPKQVKKTIERSGLSVTDACYAIAMFSSRDAFDQYHQEIGEFCNYDDMRSEIAEKHFGGNGAFEASDVGIASSSYCGSADLGGFDGGSGDGGSD